jgi:hypothetical protein
VERETGIEMHSKRKGNASLRLRGELAAVSFPFVFFFWSGFAYHVRAGTDVPLLRILLPAIALTVFFAFSFSGWISGLRRDTLPFSKETPWVCGPIAVYLAISLPRLAAFPLWDAGLFFRGTVLAAESFDFTPASFIDTFTLYGHTSHYYLILMVPGQYLFPSSALALNAASLLIGAVMVYIFYRLALAVFGHHGKKAFWATMLFALMPSLLAFNTGANPDYALLFGTVCLAYAYAANKKALMTASGFFLLFSKEPGVFLLVGFCVGILLFEDAGGIAHKKGLARAVSAIKKYWHMLLPFFALLLYVSAHGYDRFNSAHQADRPTPASNFGFHYEHIKTILAQVFVLNFNWVLIALILAAILLCIIRKEKPWPNSAIPIMVVTSGVYLIYTMSYYEVDLLRYILPILAPAPILAIWAFSAFRIGGRAQSISACALCVLFIASSFATIDPASNKVFARKYEVGEKTALLNVNRTAATPVICEAAVYNQQYFSYSALIDDILRDNGVDDARPYVSFGLAPFSFQFFGNAENLYRVQYSPSLDRRVYFSQDSVKIPGQEYFFDETTGEPADASLLPEHILWFVPPYQSDADIAKVLDCYTILSEKHYERNGFTMELYECEIIKPAGRSAED